MINISSDEKLRTLIECAQSTANQKFRLKQLRSILAQWWPNAGASAIEKTPAWAAAEALKAYLAYDLSASMADDATHQILLKFIDRLLTWADEAVKRLCEHYQQAAAELLTFQQTANDLVMAFRIQGSNALIHRAAEIAQDQRDELTGAWQLIDETTRLAPTSFAAVWLLERLIAQAQRWHEGHGNILISTEFNIGLGNYLEAAGRLPELAQLKKTILAAIYQAADTQLFN